jgi:hypothetical protein
VSIDRGVAVSVVGGTAGTSPDTITQGDEHVERATDMTQLGRWKEAVDVMDVRSQLLRRVVQDGDEAGKAQVRDLASPHRLHALQGERF